MSRLFDKIPELHFTPQPVVVDISNVAAYYGLTRQQTWDYSKDFPNVAPQFFQAFYEMREPSRKMIGGEVIDNPTQEVAHYGVLLTSFEIESAVFKSQIDSIQDFFDGLPSLIDRQIDGSKWLCIAEGFTHFSSRKSPQPSIMTAYGVDEFGKLHRIQNGFEGLFHKEFIESIEITTRIGQGFNSVPIDSEFLGIFVNEVIHPCLLAQSFMHCKNVKQIERLIPPKINLRRAKNGKPPLTKYYTLEIEAMKRTLQSEGGISTNGLKKSLHICRGHFATYTPDKPLFGHYVGTVWKPQHLKGSKDHGEIVKDYAVKGPQ